MHVGNRYNLASGVTPESHPKKVRVYPHFETTDTDKLGRRLWRMQVTGFGQHSIKSEDARYAHSCLFAGNESQGLALERIFYRKTYALMTAPNPFEVYMYHKLQYLLIIARRLSYLNRHTP